MNKTSILLTGGMGSGKSTLVKALGGMIPCFDADSGVKAFYSPSSDAPYLLPQVEGALGRQFRDTDGNFFPKALAEVIFSDPDSLRRVEAIVFPALTEAFISWRDEQYRSHDVVLFESATALDKPHLAPLWDRCVYVDAPESLRVARVCARCGCTGDEALRRMRLQGSAALHGDRIDAVIVNDAAPEDLRARFLRVLSGWGYRL